MQRPHKGRRTRICVCLRVRVCVGQSVSQSVSVFLPTGCIVCQKANVLKPPA